MKLGTKEHYELMEVFERSHSGLRLDREPKELWSRGHIYQNDETNSLFRAYREGYAFCLAANRQDDPGRLSAELAEARKVLVLASLGSDELDAVTDLLKRLAAIREWNHDDDHSARLEYDRAADDGTALIRSLSPTQPEAKEARDATE